MYEADLAVSVVSFFSRCRPMYEADLAVSVVSFISRCRSMYEADLAVSVVSFISRSMGLVQSTKSPNLQLKYHDDCLNPVLACITPVLFSVIVSTSKLGIVFEFETGVWLYILFSLSVCQI
jgi:hypothetical protein